VDVFEELERMSGGYPRGMPNVGKSTLFNALTAAGAESANYPFCTIEPTVGIVPVPDERLDRILAKIDSKKILPATVELVDIAGLVRGASKGEGLGNQFLGRIRSVDAVLAVVRCFIDEDITHVEGSIDPSPNRSTHCGRVVWYLSNSSSSASMSARLCWSV